MRSIHRSARLAFLVVAGLFLAGGAIAGFAQAMTTIIFVDGTIATIHGNTLTLTLATNATKTVAIQANTVVSRIEKSTLEAVKPGDALGVTSRRESDGSLTALRINIFSPELYKIVPRKEFVMTTGDTMTNATVTTFAKAVKGRTLTVSYPNGTSSISVPLDVPVFRMVNVKRADLVAGLHVTVRGTENPDGTIRASSISFEQPVKG
jgi:hypothetical protein